MKKILICIFLVFSSALFAKTGVVFVHGKGSSQLRDGAQAWDYWGMEFLSAATKQFTLPFFVAHYDGKLFMGDAAKIVGKQILEFIQKRKIDRLVINTHSFGGTVMRYIFSNIHNNPEYQSIAHVTLWVNAIAGPHLGSETADLLDKMEDCGLTSWLVEWLGQNNPATHNTRKADMAYYNEHFLLGTKGRPALPVQFYNIAGTGIWNDFFYTLHTQDAGLALISTLTNFNTVNDGVVSIKSAQAVGVPWFDTTANHHHSRRGDYVNIGTLLAADL